MEKKTNLIVYFVSTIILYVWKLIEINVGFSISAEHYQNPFLVLNALQIRNGTINFISKGYFTVYLLHAWLINRFNMLEYLNENIFIFLGALVIFVLTIFFVCDFIGIVYANIEKIFFDYIDKHIGFYRMRIVDESGGDIQ